MYTRTGYISKLIGADDSPFVPMAVWFTQTMKDDAGIYQTESVKYITYGSGYDFHASQHSTAGVG